MKKIVFLLTLGLSITNASHSMDKPTQKEDEYYTFAAFKELPLNIMEFGDSKCSIYFGNNDIYAELHNCKFYNRKKAIKSIADSIRKHYKGVEIEIVPSTRYVYPKYENEASSRGIKDIETFLIVLKEMVKYEILEKKEYHYKIKIAETEEQSK